MSNGFKSTGFGFLPGGGDSGGPSDSGVLMLATVSDISTTNDPNAEYLIVSAEKTGGTFEKYNGVHAIDNGVIFADATGQKWRRTIEVNYIDLNWYGVVAVNNQSNDIYAKFIAAISAANNREFTPSAAVFIPEVPTGYWYYCTQKIVIDSRIRIFGSGIGSHIRFFQNVGGFKFNYITSRFSILHDFKITQYGSSATIGSNFGIECKDILYMNFITVLQFGDGLMAWNDSAAVDSTLGNSNNLRVVNCEFSSNWRHGVYLRGADSNNSIFRDCNYVSNGGCGHFDKSFLGNSVEYPHFASNGSPEVSWQKGLVTYGGVTWASIVDDNLNNTPVEGAYWTSLGTLWVAGYPFVLAWNPATTYYTVTSINCDGANQYGTILQIYHEADQAPPYAGPGVKVFGKNVNFRNEATTAALSAGNGSLYTKAPFWIGNPGATNTLRGYHSATAAGLKYSANETILIGYNTTGKYGFITTNDAESIGKVLFTTSGTTAATLGRTTGGGDNGSLTLQSFMFGSLINSRTTFRKIDLTSVYAPSTSNLDYGDLFFVTTANYLGAKPETIVSKFIEPSVNGTKVLYNIKGFQEFVITNVTGTAQLWIDYNITANRGIMYDVIFTGSTATDDCILHHEILIVNRAGTVAVVDNTAVRADYVPGGFSAAAIVITNVGAGSGLDDINISITGLPAGTYGKVHIKRMDY